jgi:DNA-binding beta-propeller fold protein YncE
MRKRALWAGALPTIALAAAVIGPLTASTREVQEELNGTIWVANRGTAPATADTIRAFDTRTGDVTHDVHMNPGSMPGDLAVAKGKVYVSEERGPKPAVAIVDAGTGDILGRIFTDLNSRPHHVHASAGGNLVAVGLYGTDDVLVIDTRDDTPMRWDTDTAQGHESGRIHAAVFSNDESTLYLANEAGNQVIAMDPRTGTVFWRLDVPAVHELAVTHNQKLLYVSRRGANRLAVVELDPDVWVKPDKYIDVLKLDLPDTLRLSANEEVLTVGLRLPPARMAIVDTRSLQPCDAAGVCDSSSVTHAVLDETQAANSIGGHQWTSPSGRYTWASFEGPGAGVVLIDHSNPGKPVTKLSYAGQPHGVDRSHP